MIVGPAPAATGRRRQFIASARPRHCWRGLLFGIGRLARDPLIPCTSRVPAPLRVPRPAARRFLRAALLLDRPAATTGEALDHLGYVQLDPVNVCGRMHDLILRNRVEGYREGDLLRHLYGGAAPRVSFEHYLPAAGVLAALPLDAWPHLQAHMRHRRGSPGGYGGRLSAAEERLAGHILGEIAQRGPLGSDDIEHASRATTAWGTDGRMVKIVLEKLLFHGRVLIARRAGFRRVYDLPEHVLPPGVLGSGEPAPDQTARWLILLRIRQRRLVTLKRGEWPLVSGDVQPVAIDGCPPLFCLHTDVPLLADSADGDSAPPTLPPVRLLAPLDPLIYDRRLTGCLWDFDYTWEAYTPPAKRRRGHYALPVLAGLELVGHVHPRADREQRRLRIVSRAVRRGLAVAPAVRELARFLGLR